MDKVEKERLESEHSKEMNEEAVKRIQREALTKEEAGEIESVFFEDDEVIKLRDGKEYIMPPASLKNARKAIKLLETVNVDAIILNFVPTGDEEVDKNREDSLYELLKICFASYPELTKDYFDEYVDLELARKIIEIFIGLNGLKK